jgi:hypothetical protein
MASGFGFAAYPQQPAPDPRAVGQQLRMSALPAGATGPMTRAPAADAGGVSGVRPGETDATMALRLRLLGGIRMGGPGQSGTGSAPPGQPDYPTDGDHSTVNAAVGEALTRIGGGLMRNADISPVRAARRQEDLVRLGVTPFEAELLARSGGI